MNVPDWSGSAKDLIQIIMEYCENAYTRWTIQQKSG